MQESDKIYWHQYLPEYERLAFSKLNPTHILEFGVLHGSSIMWLSMRFPTAKIVGADIVPEQASWPKSSNITYVQVDQGNREEVKRLVNSHIYDLIIDDGSHEPEHQATCLIEGIKSVKGFYILEDIHTSHPKFVSRKTNAFHLLLAIKHLKKSNQKLDPLLNRLAAWSFFTEEEVRFAFDRISNIHLYKRTDLPLKCYNCGGKEFDYTTFTCRCGVDLYKENDSMSFIVEVK